MLPTTLRRASSRGAGRAGLRPHLLGHEPGEVAEARDNALLTVIVPVGSLNSSVVPFTV